MRYIGPKGVKLIGNATKEHVNLGRKFLGILQKRMQRHRIKSLRWRRTLADGTIIEVASLYGRNYIKIETPEGEFVYTLYLESGLLHLGEVQSTTPAYLYYGDQIQAAHDAGGPQRLAQLGDTGLVSATYASGLASEAVPGGGERKITQLAVPACMFSGRLRLFVQCLYGSKSPNYAYSGSTKINLTFGNDTTGRIILGYDWPSTAGLYSASDFRYFIIIGGTTTFDFYEITFSDIGTELQTWLVENSGSLTAEELVQHEAYLFGQAKLGELVSSCPITLPVDMPGPIAFGWKYNWDGSRASCVLAKENCTSNHTTQIAHVDVTFANDEFTVEVTTESASSFKFPKQTWGIIWVPDHISGGHITHVFECCPNNFDETVSYSGISIYCYYDSDDVLQTVTWSNSGGTNQGDTYTGTVHVCGEGNETYTRRWRGGDHSTNGFSFGGVDYSGYASNSSTWQEKNTSVTITTQTTFNDCDNPADTPNWNGFGSAYNRMCDPYDEAMPGIDVQIQADLNNADGYEIDVWKGDKESRLFSYTATNEHHHSMLIVPWDNAEAAYLGKFTRDTTNTTGTTDNTYEGDSLEIEKQWYEQWWTPGGGPPFAYCVAGFLSKHKNSWGGRRFNC